MSWMIWDQVTCTQSKSAHPVLRFVVGAPIYCLVLRMVQLAELGQKVSLEFITIQGWSISLNYRPWGMP